MSAVADSQVPGRRLSGARLASGRPTRAPVRIQPAGRWPSIDLRELWQFRGLLLFLVWRDIKVRYAQTIMGAGWAVLQPVIAMVVFTIIFGHFARIPSDGVPYAVFSLTALVPWTYFSTALTSSSNSLVLYPNLVTKVYFPRLMIPLAPVFAGLVDLAIAFTLLMVILAASGYFPAWPALTAIPLLLLIAMMTAAGIGAWLAALNIQYRDVKQITPFLVQVWMYATPIVYPLSVVPQEYRLAYSLNPMVAVITGFRAVLLGPGDLPWAAIGMGLLASSCVLVGGTLHFRRTERIFADVA
jgi:lipopolysaccharide transport system permease protein